MKLLYTPNCNPRIAVATARHLGVAVEFERVNPFAPSEREAFLKRNPFGFAPVLLEDGQSPLPETDAIAARLSQIAGSDFWRMDEEHVEMIRWISWSKVHLHPTCDALYFDRVVRPTFTDERADPAELDAALASFREIAPLLDGVLAGREWLVGGRPSYADFRLAMHLPYADQAGIPVGEFPNIAAFNARLNGLPGWRDSLKGLA